MLMGSPSLIPQAPSPRGTGGNGGKKKSIKEEGEAIAGWGLLARLVGQRWRRPESLSFLQGLGGGLGKGRSYSTPPPKTMGQGKFSEGVCAVSPLCFCSTNHMTQDLSSPGEIEAQGKEVTSPRMQDRVVTSAPASLEVAKAWDCLDVPALVPRREADRASSLLRCLGTVEAL